MLLHVLQEREFPMVGFLACVNTHMPGQVVVASKGYTALAALVGFLSGVRSHMPLQITYSIATFLALVSLLSCPFLGLLFVSLFIRILFY